MYIYYIVVDFCIFVCCFAGCLQPCKQIIICDISLFYSGLYRKMQSMCALPIKTVQWTRGGETAASSAVSKNVWQWGWSKKVMQCQSVLTPSVTNV